MITFNEWSNSKIQMSFQERYNMLLNRLSALSTMKSSADYTLNKKRDAAIGSCCGYYGTICGDKSVDELVSDVELMWDELKKEIISAVKEKEKLDKSI